MAASVLAFHLDNGSQQAGFHCLLSRARVSGTSKSPVLIFQLPSTSAHYSYYTVANSQLLPTSHLPAPQLLRALKLYYARSPVLSFQLHRLLRVLQLYYNVTSSELPAPQLLRVLQLYYKVASAHLPAAQILHALKLYYPLISSHLPPPQLLCVLKLYC